MSNIEELSAENFLLKEYECESSETLQYNVSQGVHVSNVINWMEAYASIKCKEQREICADAYIMHDRLNNTTEAIEKEADAIENAPEPK